MSADEKFRCRSLNEWRLTPCSEGENKHDCKPGFCGVPCEGSLVGGATGSGRVYSFQDTLAGELSREPTVPERSNEVAMPRFEAATPPQPPRPERPPERMVDVEIGREPGIVRSVRVPESLADRVHVPPMWIHADDDGNVQAWRWKLVDEQFPLLAPTPPPPATPSFVEQDSGLDVMPPAPELNDDGSLSVTNSMPPDSPLFLPSLHAEPARDSVGDDDVSCSSLAIKPPGWVDPTAPPPDVGPLDPFTPGGLP
jgi:hypothetical protein